MLFRICCFVASLKKVWQLFHPSSPPPCTSWLGIRKFIHPCLEELDGDLDGTHGEAPGGADDGALEHQFGEIEALKLESQLDDENEVKLEIDER